ncbi:hypothetical protein D8674_042737 [Pyrus ussuriensis x Pyrus communis]|uniref:Late embryogenesis abundant protein LEA-2 subgroup domain-containing protein n=1 Tax=Pyrus ussuriensis x Pyrus communis TaxID=2448454 RepID=A0A5N5FP99_9ROSA|nr:hypothetical protein D8674_032447 [Pyrus ussuriensis x Pyrus communis]KAB2604707.1 hypothetical protein D8674_042737 [Pyrus ussuriensis x Pyrus communis]
MLCFDRGALNDIALIRQRPTKETLLALAGAYQTQSGTYAFTCTKFEVARVEKTNSHLKSDFKINDLGKTRHYLDLKFQASSNVSFGNTIKLKRSIQKYTHLTLMYSFSLQVGVFFPLGRIGDRSVTQPQAGHILRLASDICISRHSDSLAGETLHRLPVRRSTNVSTTPTIAKFTFLIFPSLVTLAIIVFLPFIHKELTLGPQAPVVQLTALSVHKFNVSDKNLTAEWDVKLKIANPNLVSYIWFNRLEGFVLYEDRPLVVKPEEPFGLPMKTKTELHLRLRMANWEGDQPALKQWMLEKMKKDRELGGVRFSVQMAIWATYRSGWWWSAQHVIMNLQCLDLQIGFMPGATAIGFGILMADVPTTCYVPMLAE